MTSLQALCAYLPHWRLDATTVAAAWGAPAGRGRRAIADRDEDPLTLAFAATSGLPSAGPAIDAVYFASTSAPYLEKQTASVLAAALGVERTARTLDVAASRRGWVTAIGLAIDGLAAGSLTTAVVATGELRSAEPRSADELGFADAGGAALLSVDGTGAEVLAVRSVHADDLGSWRRTDDPHVRHGEQRHAAATFELEPAQLALRDALAAAGVAPADVAAVAYSASQPAHAGKLLAGLGIDAPVFVGSTEKAGYAGAAHPALCLAAALGAASPGDVVALVATGDGADALVVRADASCVVVGPDVAGTGSDHEVAYASFLRSRGALAQETEPPRSSPVAHHRDTEQHLRLSGIHCSACGQVQYPATSRCAYCGAEDVAPVALARHGRVQTFTTDHIVAGINPGNGEGVVTMAVVDLDGGGRVFVQCTSDYSDVAIDDEVELVLRHLHDGSGFKNYYWKARPAARRGSN